MRFSILLISVGSHLNYVFTSPQTVANSSQMKSVEICRFKTSVVEICFRLDISVYMLKCVFC